jgi:hypothetical protein
VSVRMKVGLSECLSVCVYVLVMSNVLTT